MTQHDDDIAMYQQEFDDLLAAYKRVAADNERLLAKLGELERQINEIAAALEKSLDKDHK